MKRDTLQELATTVWERDSQPGEYLTDGFRLYRVVVSRVFHEERLVELEDCRTLDVWLVSADELSSLRPVRGPKAGLADRRDPASSWSTPGSGPEWWR
jgi:hypothetical protein